MIDAFEYFAGLKPKYECIYLAHLRSRSIEILALISNQGSDRLLIEL